MDTDNSCLDQEPLARLSADTVLTNPEDSLPQCLPYGQMTQQQQAAFDLHWHIKPSDRERVAAKTGC